MRPVQTLLLLCFLLLPFFRAEAGVPLQLELSGATVFPVGSWGQHLSSGLSASLGATWRATRSLGAGLLLEGEIYSSSGALEASLTRLSTMAQFSAFLRPGSPSFSPGIVLALGITRSDLSSGAGEDPPTWDPSWRAGVRWGFSLGGGFRCRTGFDFGGVMAEGADGDYFDMRLGLVREVSL
ncbi:hypothetical protein JW921_03165 [Candidatus Fermentibacterales bacterium]|nr:hypothetical protein [Candidatus Fermentibacterales bacterium]